MDEQNEQMEVAVVLCIHLSTTTGYKAVFVPVMQRVKASWFYATHPELVDVYFAIKFDQTTQ